MGLRTPPISHRAHEWLLGYAFPGNVRELKHLMARALIQSGGGEIQPQHLQPEAAGPPQPSAPTISKDELPLDLRAAELAVIEKAMSLADGNVAEAARLLGVHRMKIYRRIAKAEP
jgi:DNA-binding NtrC family response regulator